MLGVSPNEILHGSMDGKYLTHILLKGKESFGDNEGIEIEMAVFEELMKFRWFSEFVHA